jgi:serine/threonine protein phosphatase PrpC
MGGAAAGFALPEGGTADPAETRVGPGAAVLFSVGCPSFAAANEDTAALVRIDARRAALIVADGLGGRPGGESASKTAVRTVEKYLRRVRGRDAVRSAILDALDEANRAIIDLGIGAGTTVAIAELEDDRVRGYHVGDSAILVVGQRGRVKLRTVCHAPTAYAVESGLLDEADALHHADRHLVSNVVGDPGMRIEVGSWVQLSERDTLLLATDGVFDNLHAHEVVKAIRTGSLAEAGRRLAHASIKRMKRPARGAPSKPDDLTFILYRADPAVCSTSRTLSRCA